MLSKRVKQARDVRGLTQAELAKASGLHRNTIQFIESGGHKQPAAMTVGAIAKALGVDLGWLLYGKKNRAA